ncbi:hypothetical protein [Streptomyces pseudovenezuelae]|uniref:Cellulase n=1 Tax=Streptomyces pseudovenezuelae TaxID=67350 RepID=A0ABT6LAY0_9ACTN|nr:hypothetical protein [Streptomyces pseudovenezuelae]MDH6213470.1 hypothetical protein [Streptomyces pseudovenezuelae]
MDHFERELARMMRDTRETTPFEPRHQTRLRSGVRARRRVRAAQRAVGSVLAVAGISLGFFLLPHDRVDNRPQAPLPRPAVTPTLLTAGPTRTPDSPPSATISPTGTDTTGSPTTPTSTPTGSSTASSSDPPSTDTAPPPSGPATSGAPSEHSTSTPTTTPPTTETSATVGTAGSG